MSIHSASDFGYRNDGPSRCVMCGSNAWNCCDGDGGPFPALTAAEVDTLREIAETDGLTYHQNNGGRFGPSQRLARLRRLGLASDAAPYRITPAGRAKLGETDPDFA